MPTSWTGTYDDYSGTQFSTILGFSDQIFTGIVLLLAAGISSHLRYGIGTKKAKEMLLFLILCLMVGLQLYHLVFAAIHVPADKFHVWSPKLHREDCLYSTKGGKRSMFTSTDYTANPCFCHANAVCTMIGSGDVVTPSTDCPTDGTAVCTFDGEVIEPDVSFKRNCRGGQADLCTVDQPCYPCDWDTLEDWGSDARCNSCTTDNTGDCNFIPYVGPYCYKEKGSKDVVPCTKCCTDITAKFDTNNKCY